MSGRNTLGLRVTRSLASGVGRREPGGARRGWIRGTSSGDHRGRSLTDGLDDGHYENDGS